MKGLLAILILAMVSCSQKQDKPSHIADLIYSNMIEVAGQPTDVIGNDSIAGSSVLYRYKFLFKDGVNKSTLIKNSIDKTLNMLPIRDNPKHQSLEGSTQIILGDYGWETPQVKADINYFTISGKSDSSFVNVWIERK